MEYVRKDNSYQGILKKLKQKINVNNNSYSLS